MKINNITIPQIYTPQSQAKPQHQAVSFAANDTFNKKAKLSDSQAKTLADVITISIPTYYAGKMAQWLGSNPKKELKGVQKFINEAFKEKGVAPLTAAITAGLMFLGLKSNNNKNN